MHPCPARPASLARAPPPRGGGHHSAAVPRRRRLFRTPARQLVTSQASRPGHVDDINDGREPPPEPHGRRDAVVQAELECPDPLVGGVVVPEAVLEPPRRRTRRTPTLRPARRCSGGAPPAAGTAPSRRRAPATVEGATSRTIPCRGTGTVATTPRRCASVDGGLGPPYVLASLCRLPRSRLVLLLLGARIAGVADGRLTTARRRPLASGQRRALLRLSLLRPPRARRESTAQQAALPTVHRSLTLTTIPTSSED